MGLISRVSSRTYRNLLFVMPPKKKGKKKGGEKKAKEKPDQNIKQQLDLTKHQLDIKIIENNENKEHVEKWKNKQLNSENVLVEERLKFHDIHQDMVRQTKQFQDAAERQTYELTEMVANLRFDVAKKEQTIDDLQQQIKELQLKAELNETHWRNEVRKVEKAANKRFEMAMTEIKQRVAEKHRQWTKEVTVKLENNKNDLRSIGVRPLDF